MSQSIRELAQKAKAASVRVGRLPTATKNGVLRGLAAAIEKSNGEILAANEADVAHARSCGLGEAKLRRLTLTPEAIAQMAEGLRQVSDLEDPVGQVTNEYTVPSGLRVSRVRTPLGVIMMIYEARPNVTIDAFALSFKAGNACILKGGKEACRSNTLLSRLAQDALQAEGLPRESLTLLSVSNREELKELLTLHECIDLVIPRGGAELIRFVHEHSRIPTVQHFQGVCHIFVDATAAPDKAIEICTTAKTSAPAACNAVEAILVHEAIAFTFVPQLVSRLVSVGVEARGDAQVCAFSGDAVPASDDDWGHEFLDLIVAIRIVSDLDAAVSHIAQFGSNHTDVILTKDKRNAKTFCKRVQSSCVLVNASTRFNDGFQLGLGAEIGISTSRIHAYGPMGLEGLTIERFVVHGDGHAR